MDTDHAQRLTSIESHVANLEYQLEQLNQVVIEQGRELSRLKTWQQRIAQSVEAGERARVDTTTVKPPHYQ